MAFVLACNYAQAKGYDVLAFGAKPDGKTLNTVAFQRAIDQASKAGGGRVVVPAGKYVIGTIFLKTAVELHLETGARLIGSGKIADYTPMSWGGDGNKDRQPYHLIAAKGAKQIAITGRGVIDGNGKAFWATGQELFDLPVDSIPPSPKWILAKAERVSPTIELQDCEDVLIEDITLTNPSGWTLHLLNSKKATIRGIRILNNLFSPNSDGIDLTGCQDVTISDCIINTCDDAICLKTSPDGMATRRIAVTNCIIKTMCVALKLGNESWGDMSDIAFSNCVVTQSSRIVGIYARDGGMLENIVISNIVGDTRAPFIFNRPIHISLMQQNEKKRGGIRNVLIQNFLCKTDGRILVTAPVGDSIVNLVMRDVHLIYPRIENPEPLVAGARSNQFSPGNPEARAAKAAFVIENVKGLVIEGARVEWPSAAVPLDWQYKERIEHGGSRRFTPDYSKARETEMDGLWLRGVVGARIAGYKVSPSGSGQQAISEKNCSNVVVLP